MVRHLRTHTQQQKMGLKTTQNSNFMNSYSMNSNSMTKIKEWTDINVSMHWKDIFRLLNQKEFRFDGILFKSNLGSSGSNKEIIFIIQIET